MSEGKIRVFTEVNMDASNLPEEMIQAGSVQILNLLMKIVDDTKDLFPKTKSGEILVPMSALQMLVEGLKKKAPIIVTATSLEDAHKKIEEMG